VARLFFLLSGEFESLSFSELKAILKTEGFPFNITEQLDQTVRLEADIESIKQVQRRSAYTRVCAQEIFTCKAKETDIVEAVRDADFGNVLSKKESFEVRIRRIKEYATKEATMDNERLLGKLILQKVPGARVDLKHAEKTFFGVLTNDKLVFGIKLAEIIPKPFVERRARKKPFFHPSAMNAKLARCMVNLANAKTNDYVLDPFSGTGSTLIEATLIGCKAIGIDVQRRMANGTLRNTRHFGLEPEGILKADARELPLWKIDCVVTDPPYGRSSTTMKSNTKAIVAAVLKSAYQILGKGQRICIAAPKTLNITKMGQRLGYAHIESNFAYVHRTLTREVAVFEKE
jgi:tRNA (guanine10-N2)-dimethyltransferase